MSDFKPGLYYISQETKDRQEALERENAELKEDIAWFKKEAELHDLAMQQNKDRMRVLEAENTAQSKEIADLKKLISDQDHEALNLEEENADLKARLAKFESTQAECVHCGAWDNIDVEHWRVCPNHPANKEIADLKAQLAEIKAVLPDDFSPSKDWQQSGPVERIEWLKGMYRDAKAWYEALVC